MSSFNIDILLCKYKYVKENEGHDNVTRKTQIYYVKYKLKIPNKFSCFSQH